MKSDYKAAYERVRTILRRYGADDEKGVLAKEIMQAIWDRARNVAEALLKGEAR